MKKAIFLLFFIFNLCALNLWSQSEESEFPNGASANAVIENMSICFINPQWNGIVYMESDGQPLYRGYWGEGYLITKTMDHIHFNSQIDVYPGGQLKIWVRINAIGDTNTIYLTVPEPSNYHQLRLNIQGYADTMNQINAYFDEY